MQMHQEIIIRIYRRERSNMEIREPLGEFENPSEARLMQCKVVPSHPADGLSPGKSPPRGHMHKHSRAPKNS